jgi:hypothetical protein
MRFQVSIESGKEASLFDADRPAALAAALIDRHPDCCIEAMSARLSEPLGWGQEAIIVVRTGEFNGEINQVVRDAIRATMPGASFSIDV